MSAPVLAFSNPRQAKASSTLQANSRTAALERYARLHDVQPGAAALFDEMILELLADHDREQKGGA